MTPVLAERIKAALPDFGDATWAEASFRCRAARWLAGERRVAQFVDIRQGPPGPDDVGDAVRWVNPAARVVHVDARPAAATPAAAPGPAGSPRPSAPTGPDVSGARPRPSMLIRADVRSPEAVLSDAGLRALIDFREPVALLMTTLMHFVEPEADPWGLVRRCLSECVPGSHLVLSHATADRIPAGAIPAGAGRGPGERMYLRSRAEVERFFRGMELVPPYHGAPPCVCSVGEWGAEDPDAADGDGSRILWCGVARLP